MALIAVLGVLKRRCRMIIAVALCGTAMATGYAFFSAPVYRARAVIAPPEKRETRAATAAFTTLGGLSPQVAGNLGIFLGGADENRLQALLSSHRLLERVITKHHLLPVLFVERWDSRENNWSVSHHAQIPNVWDAERLLKDRIFKVQADARLGVLRLTADYRDPKTAKLILQQFLDELASILQEDEIKKIEQRISFIQKQLAKTKDPFMAAKFKSLLSKEMEDSVMARNLEPFAYELIDPPSVSDVKLRPKTTVLISLGLTLSLCFGTLLGFWLESFQKDGVSSPGS